MRRKRKASSSYMEMKRRRKRNALIMIFLLLPAVLYLSFCVGGLFNLEITIENLQEMYIWCLKHPMECINDKSGALALAGFTVWMMLSITYYTKINNNLMPGKEFGEAKWGDIKEFNRKYGSKNEEENRILSENIRFRYDSSTLRNNNTFIGGGSGSGKTSFVLTPNLLNMYGSDIVIDPKGGLIKKFGNYLKEEKGKRVYCLNFCDMEKSMRINPFLFMERTQDVMKLVTNLIQNTDSSEIRANSADPFWEKAEKMGLYSIFTYVWRECPMSAVDPNTGDVFVLEKNMKSVLHLIAEAKMEDSETPSLLDVRMKELEKREPNHPAVRAYNRYRSGPMDTIRSVLMTINARMQIFDDEELLEIFTGNDIPLDEFGVGKDGDGKTGSCLFMVIPDEDDTYNFAPGMIYTLLLQILYRQARYFDDDCLPIEVGFWMDEFANVKMPSNFPKIMSTCRSRGIYCIIMLQSLSQMKKIFADGEWEGVIGNCDTFLYLGGNEPSTFEYISKLLGKWTIDKKTSGESRGVNGSFSENYDVIGRELMQEYEVRLLPDDECILFVRGEEPLRDKKWFPWEHQEYEKALSYGIYNNESRPEAEETCRFLNEDVLEYQKKMARNNSKIQICGMDTMEFMLMDLDALEKEQNRLAFEGEDIAKEIPLSLLAKKYKEEVEKETEEHRQRFIEVYDSLSLLEIFSFDYLGEIRRQVIQELLKLKVPEKDIKEIVHPCLTEGAMLAKKKAYFIMHSMQG